jgi:hypothetical protein
MPAAHGSWEDGLGKHLFQWIIEDPWIIFDQNHDPWIMIMTHY